MIAQTLLMMAVSLFVIYPLYARDLKASLGFVPMLAETPEKGFAVDFVKALDEVYTDGTISIDVYPTNRSMDNVVKGSHDFMIPMLLTDSMNPDELPFTLFDSLWEATFVLYTNKNNTRINPDNVSDFKGGERQKRPAFF